MERKEKRIISRLLKLLHFYMISLSLSIPSTKICIKEPLEQFVGDEGHAKLGTGPEDSG